MAGIGAASALSLARATAAPFPEGGQDVWKGIELVGSDGRALTLGQLAAPVVIVHVWASWCAACLGELPSLQGLAQRLGPASVAPILVSHPKHWEADQAFLRRSRVQLPAYTLAPGASWETRVAVFDIVGGSYAVPRSLIFAGRDRRCVLVKEGPEDWRSPQVAARLRAWARPASA